MKLKERECVKRLTAIEDTSLDEWRWLMSINLDGVFLGTKYAMGAMKKSGGAVER